MISVYLWQGEINHLSLGIVQSNPNLAMYISFFPPRINSQSGFRVHTYEQDAAHQRLAKCLVLPSIEKCGYGFSEQKIYDWWTAEFSNEPHEFGWLKHNCSTIVLEALKHGAMDPRLLAIMNDFSPLIYTPGNVRNYLKQFSHFLQKAHTAALVEVDDYIKEFFNILNDIDSPAIRQLLQITSYLVFINNIDMKLHLKSGAHHLLQQLTNLIENIKTIINANQQPLSALILDDMDNSVFCASLAHNFSSLDSETCDAITQKILSSKQEIKTRLNLMVESIQTTAVNRATSFESPSSNKSIIKAVSSEKIPFWQPNSRHLSKPVSNSVIAATYGHR